MAGSRMLTLLSQGLTALVDRPLANWFQMPGGVARAANVTAAFALYRAPAYVVAVLHKILVDRMHEDIGLSLRFGNARPGRTAHSTRPALRKWVGDVAGNATEAFLGRGTAHLAACRANRSPARAIHALGTWAVIRPRRSPSLH